MGAFVGRTAMVTGKTESMDDGEDGAGLGNLEGGRGSSRREHTKRHTVVIKSTLLYDTPVATPVGTSSSQHPVTWTFHSSKQPGPFSRHPPASNLLPSFPINHVHPILHPALLQMQQHGWQYIRFNNDTCMHVESVQR